MVKEIDCNDQIVEIELKRRCIDPGQFRKIYFRQDAQDDRQIIKEMSILKELAEDYPGYFQSSYLFKGGVSGTRRTLHVLLVPINCPPLALDLEMQMSGGEPDESMTYLVDVRRSFGEPSSIIWPAYASDCDFAVKVARKQVSRRFGWNKAQLRGCAQLVSGDEFYERAKNLVLQGFKLSEAVLWIRDLRRIAVERGTFKNFEKPRDYNLAI